ncbi:ATP-binding protein [Bradyrhizobium sp. USDA 336]|uniref:ATP-binding protein n=1 Tax=Bradyrhizobium sp. USDA 336 TaxID=3156311 RepID=UPI00384C3EB9
MPIAFIDRGLHLRAIRLERCAASESAVEAIKAGRSVCFSSLADIVASPAETKPDRALLAITAAVLLMINKMLPPVIPRAGNLFFQFLNVRYEGAIILTSNRGFAKKWAKSSAIPSLPRRSPRSPHGHQTS